MRVGSALGRGQGARDCSEDPTAHGGGAGQGLEARSTLARAAPGPRKEARVNSHAMPGKKRWCGLQPPTSGSPPALPAPSQAPTLNREVDDGVGRHCKMHKEAS